MANKIVFPSYLSNDNYKYRKVTMHILHAKTPGSNAADAYEQALKNGKNVISATSTAGATAVSDSFSAILDNLSANNEKYKAFVKESTVFTITLPLPNNLTESQGHSWEPTTGIIGGAIQEIENQSIVGKGITELANKIPVIGSGIAAAGNTSISKALGSLSDVNGTRKPLGNPGYFQNYKGTRPRTFNFSFDLVPNNPEEAKDMLNIVLQLKKFSSPELVAGGVGLLAPHYFDIELSNPHISKLANINGVVLTSIDVNYGADGNMQQYSDGTPKFMNLNLKFNERRMTSKNDYDKPS